MAATCWGGHSGSNMNGDKTEANLGGQDYWVVKLDPFGNIQWQNTIGGNYNDFLKSIIQSSDGGYLLGGYSESDISGDKTEDSSFSLSDYWVVKLDEAGNIEWQNTIAGGHADYLNSIIQTDDGGYLLGGYSLSGIWADKTEANMGSWDYWVVKLDRPLVLCVPPADLYVSDLTPTSVTLNWTASGLDADGYKLQLHNIATGSVYSKWLPAGTTSRNISAPSLTPGTEYGFRLRATCNDGSTTEWSPLYYFTTPLRIAGINNDWKIYPNPGNGQFNLQLSGLNNEMVQADVFNLTGAMVHSVQYSTSDGVVAATLDLNHLPEGSYFLRLTSGEQVFMEQLMIQH